MPALNKLLAILDLQPLGDNRFLGSNLDVGLPWVFGGQLLSQAVAAADATVTERHLHSVHAHFVRRGNLAEPILYQVEPMRDGSTFSARSVRARQHGEILFSANLSFKRNENGLDHQSVPMPDAPAPEDLPDRAALNRELAGSAPAYLRRYWPSSAAIDIRPVLLDRYRSRGRLPPQHQVWFRTVGPVPDQRHHPALLAFASDMTVLDTALFPHGRTIFDSDLQIGSLDHGLWIHRPFRVDEWLLFVQNSPSAAGGTAFVEGRIFSRDGRLVATVGQQGLVRLRSGEIG